MKSEFRFNIEGNRKFILVTNNESDICRKVTIPRITRAIATNGYDEEFIIILGSCLNNLIAE